MLKNKRLQKILELVNKQGEVSLHVLMRETQSSESTIRADLVQLEKEKKLVRVHGGAQALEQTSALEASVNSRYMKNLEEKKRVAQCAASLIKNDSIIYMDAGTTTACMCDYINVRNLTVVTNSLTIAHILTAKHYTVYVTGGMLKSELECFLGAFTKEIINKFTFDIGFFGTNGISIEQGFTTPNYEEAVVKQTAFDRCKKIYVLSDQSKFGNVSGVSFGDLNKATIITDKRPKNFYVSTVVEVK